VQGRYFVPALPAMAIALAALSRRGLPEVAIAALALALALLAGAATIEAHLRTDWS
jgi:hypothetical protein